MVCHEIVTVSDSKNEKLWVDHLLKKALVIFQRLLNVSLVLLHRLSCMKLFNINLHDTDTISHKGRKLH